MGSYAWSLASFKRGDKSGFEAAVPAEWLKFEADSQAVYNAAKAKARKLLNSGKRAEAIKLLNDAAYTIWEKAETLLKIKAAEK